MLCQLINQTFYNHFRISQTFCFLFSLSCVKYFVSRRVNEGICFACSLFFCFNFLPSNAIVIPKKFIVKGMWLKKTLLCVFAFKFEYTHSRRKGICVRWVNNFVLLERILQGANAFVVYNCAKNMPTFFSLDGI